MKERVLRDDAGRVHLSLLRDPATGRETVALRAPPFEEGWENAAVTVTATAVLETLEHEPTPARVATLARRLMKSTSELVATLLSAAPDGAVACQPGCDHCCHQIVGVSPAEALAIVEHLRQTRSASELDALALHVAALWERARERSAAERISPEHPCAFLERGRCSIYDARPLACRSVHSLDAEECRRRLRDAGARAEFLAQGHGGRCYVQPLRASRAVQAGLQLGLSELYGLDARGLDLLAAMHLLLNGDEALAPSWLGGHAAFEPAVRPTPVRHDSSK
jgi:Fe-S-cluster containining protein